MKAIAKLTVGALFAGAMTTASAFVPSGDEDADIVIRHSGATASSQSLIRSVLQVCDAAGDNHAFVSELGGSGDTTDFFDTGNRHGGDYFVIACEVDAAGTAAVPLNLQGGGSGTGGLYTMLYYKRDPGGSAMGVQPLANNSDVGYMSVVTDCPSPAGSDVWVDCADSPTVSYVGPSHVGTSDVEPVVFTAGENNTGAGIDWNNDNVSNNVIPTDAEISALASRVTAYLTFGVPANYRMYTALQYAQFPTGHPDFADCNPAGANYGDIAVDTDNAASEKCMPNLSTQQINSLFVRNRTVNLLTELFAPTTFGGATLQSVWDFIPATGTAYAQDTYVGSGGFGGAAPETVVVCRRTEGSGTGAQHMLFYHNYPCDRDAADLAIDVNLPETEAAFGFNGVREGTGSSRVSDCLASFDDGTNQGSNAPNPDGFVMAALGLQSSTRSEDDDHNWRYIKIDGHSPSLANVHAGKYEQVYGQTWQTASIASGNELEVINALITASSTPSFADSLNNTQTFGRLGWLANAGTGNCGAACTADETLVESAPVYPFVRESNGGKPNSCSIPRAASFPAGAGIGIGD